MKNTCQPIRTSADAANMLELCNGFHDGMITSVNYTADVTVHETGGYEQGSDELILRILLTSIIGCPTVEMIFRNVTSWQITGTYLFGAIFDCAYGIYQNILWADAPSSDRVHLQTATYVCATKVEWRIVETKQK